MKKFIALIILLAAFVANAAAPSAYTDAVGVFDYEEGDTIGAAYDTVKADNDTSVLFANFVPEQGYEYILGRTAITGTGADSITIELGMRCEYPGGTAICTVYVDSFTAAAGEYVSFPFSNYPAGQYDIFVIGYAGIGSQVIFNKMQWFRRKPLFYRKSWH